MDEKIVVKRTAQGTIVTVTLKENGITAIYPYKSSALRISDSVKYARKNAQEMLDQIKEERNGRFVE